MKIQIREYQNSDYDVCLALSRELAQHHAGIYGDPAIARGDSVKWLDGLLKRNGYVGMWLAEVGGQTAGFAGLFSYGEEGEIEPVVVASAFRNRGIGTKLIRHVVAEAGKSKVRFLSIRPVARNKEALALFVRLGFNLVGHVELFQDLSPKSDRKWKSGITIHGKELKY
jgi:ribosomal protein S18 acetylase RimI-like enzyme